MCVYIEAQIRYREAQIVHFSMLTLTMRIVATPLCAPGSLSNRHSVSGSKARTVAPKICSPSDVVKDRTVPVARSPSPKAEAAILSLSIREGFARNWIHVVDVWRGLIRTVCHVADQCSLN